MQRRASALLLLAVAAPTATIHGVGAASAAIDSQDGAEQRCVRCPVCLRSVHSGCVGAPLRGHRDCRRGNAMCSRSVYECPGTDFFFTHPTVSPEELSQLYATGFPGRVAKLSNPNHPRPLAQAEFINHNFPALPSHALVVEIGCSFGSLLARFALPTRTLVCFEPTASTAQQAKEVLTATGATAHVINGLWDAQKLRSVVGNRTIDLLMTSHVLEHIPDLCSFTSEIFAMMSVNGVVFSEVPNHTKDFVTAMQGGSLHLSFPTPRGFLLVMESAGFSLGAMSTHKDYHPGVAAHGGWLRSGFIKPDEAKLYRSFGLEGMFIGTRPRRHRRGSGTNTKLDEA